ncbi:MAG: hypothetical protein HXN96_07995 [Prevotella salivae]|nr:hypothetical protein [Segatella salivae]
MTEQEYKEQRAHWVGVAMNINRKFFPRCFMAKIREIAKLDAAHDGRDFEEVKRELIEEFCNVER